MPGSPAGAAPGASAGAITQALGNHQADSHLATIGSSKEPAFQGTSWGETLLLLAPHVQVVGTHRD